MSTLIAGLVLFFGVHTLTTLREMRAGLVERLGPGLYKGAYSLVSLIGFVLIVLGYKAYRAAGYVDVWTPPTGMRHLTILLMWPAMICLVAAYVPWRDQATSEAPDARRREDLGVGAPAQQWRSWLHHPVRVVPGLGGLRSDLGQEAG